MIGCGVLSATAQQPPVTVIALTVTNAQQVPLENATVELLRSKDSALVRSAITDISGIATLDNIAAGRYVCRVSMVNYTTFYTATVQVAAGTATVKIPTVVLTQSNTLLKEVTVSARKPFVQLLPDKTVVNVDAGITNAGATALEILEKSPGVSVDRDGNISLKGKQNVLVMIDGKLTYLSGNDLATYLGGMSASQLEQIEIMTNPPSKYDAAGNAGIINIKTKKNRQKGFNGILSTSYGQGVYWKNNNNLQLNYRAGKVNLFLNYTYNNSKFFTDLYALRKYYDKDGTTITAKLDQPTMIISPGYTQNLKAGVDYFMSKNTTLGFTFTGMNLSRTSGSKSTARWLNAQDIIDSVIESSSDTKTGWRNAGANINLRHNFSSTSELTADVDYLGYRVSSLQHFVNTLTGTGGYTEEFQGDLPSRIHIYSAKVDYTKRLDKSMKLEAGWKSGHVNTDNVASYFYRDGADWKEDWGKTNHFKYRENIHAAYAQLQKELGKWSLQGGLRYELTSYDAKQLGNVMRKDSSFSRNYNSLFPTMYISYKADSLNTFTINAGRRIDRPPFQKLNPFVFIINKYTFQQGNPFYRPQYTWNFEASHLFKDVLITTVSYSITKDYFSQIFLSDTLTGAITYTEGNLGRMESLGLSMSTQLNICKWWSLTAQAGVYNKKIRGVVWNTRRASLVQGNMNINNQFHFSKGWAAELSAFGNTSLLELQETTDPTGQIAAGVSKQILQNKGTLKFTIRDIFYSQAMKGLTTFQQASEYFKLTRDTRVATLAFTYRFGKATKSTRRSNGGASDEIKRVGAG
ncbi:MAG: TonB-dependent receptor [Chitinophagaceae bacterium]